MAHNISPVPYYDRKTWLICHHEIAGWKLKVYGITADGEEISGDIIEAALMHATEHVPWPDHNGACYGFLTIHAGEQAVWLLVDAWVNDIMHHFLFSGPLVAPTHFTPGPNDGTAACVWELEVLKHERDTWVRYVLSQPSMPDFEGYFKDCLEIAAPCT